MSPRRDRTILGLWVGVLAACGVIVGAAAPASLAARRDARHAVEHHRTIVDRSSRLDALRAAAPAWAASPRARDPLTPRLSATLAACGLPPESLASVSADDESSRDAGGVRIVTRRASVTLAKLTLPGLGRFLRDWRERAPEWTVTSIEIAPDTSRPPTPGADLSLRVSIVVETTHAADPEGGDS